MNEQDRRLRFPVSRGNSVDIIFDRKPTIREITNAARMLLAQVEAMQDDAPAAQEGEKPNG